MKKFAKVSLITAGILFAVGFVFCFIAAVTGGRKLYHTIREDEMFGQRIESFVNGLDHVVYEVSEGEWVLKWDEEDRLLTEAEFQIPMEGISEWNIELGAGTFIIEEKEEADGYMDVSVSGVGSCDYKIEGNTLYMEGFKGIRVLGTGNPQNIINVKLPKDSYFQEIDVKVGAGIAEISSLQTGDLEAEIGAGELRLEEIAAEELSVEIGAGMMDASEMQVRNADLSVAIGEGIFEGSITGELEAECDMGSLELSLTGSENEHNYEIECSAGNIELGDYQFATLAAEKMINNGASSNFEIKCNMGNISIEFEE